jgi:hypothetical protein
MGVTEIWVTPTVVCRAYHTPANGRYVAKISGDPVWTAPNIDEECFKWDGSWELNDPIGGPTYISGLQKSKSWSRIDKTAHSVWVGGQIIDWQCTVSLSIPTCPDGMYLERVEYYDTQVGGTLNTNSNFWTDPGFFDKFVNASSFSYEPNNLEGSSAGWHTLAQPTDGVDWADSAHITPVYFTVSNAKFVYRSDDDVDPSDPCYGIEAASITSIGAVLSSTNYPDAHWQWGVEGDAIGDESEDGILTGLEPGHRYWYKLLSYCETKTFWFETEEEEDEPEDEDYWNGCVITLPATEVWATGATIHGLLKLPQRKNEKTFYLYLGFQYGIMSDLSLCRLGSAANGWVIWLYSGNYTAGTTRATMYPFQMTIAGLLPDRTYYYRACLHVGTPPMNVNNYFGATLSFGGPQSIFGEGREYVTAKKAEDDISKAGVGRFFMTKDGIFKYESRNYRDV